MGDTRLQSDVEKLNRRYVLSSKSIKRRIVNDYEYAYELAEQLDIKLDIPKYKVEINDSTLFSNQVAEYIFDMESIADVVIGMFKSMDFYNFKRLGNYRISKKETEELMKSFLDYFLSDLYYIYLDLLKDDRVYITDLGTNLGESFFLNSLHSYYMSLSENNKNPILMMETIIHELVHIYSFIFLSNYRYKGIDNLNNGFFGETLSLYSELSLYEFLKGTHVFGDGLELQRNSVDFNLLCYFKTVKYLAEMMKRPGAVPTTNNCDYEIFGDNLLDIEPADTIYYYHPSYSKGSILDCRYAMSSIDAFKLLEREKNGEDPGKLMREYLIDFQDEAQMGKFLDSYIDLDFMYHTIEDRNMSLKKRFFK